MPLNAYERETVIVINDAEELALVHTARRATITRLKKNPAATLLEESRFEGTPTASFTIPRELVSFRTKRPTRTLTSERRAELAERMRR